MLLKDNKIKNFPSKCQKKGSLRIVFIIIDVLNFSPASDKILCIILLYNNDNHNNSNNIKINKNNA